MTKGDNSKPCLFFIHGMWSYANVWRHIAPALAAHGYTTHCAKLPGHDGEPGDLTTLGLKDYVDALESQAKAYDNLILVGHSMGALLAQQLATRLQPKALVLISTAPSAKIFALSWSAFRTMWPVVRRWRFWRQATLLPAGAAAYGIGNTMSIEESNAEYLLLQPDSGRVAFELSFPWADEEKAAAVDYAKLEMPVLLICGDKDRLTMPAVTRATAQRIGAQAETHWMHGFGHWTIGLQGAGAVAEKITTFLGKHNL
jgi:pimeloyl-ACP methyl ester carboxylesterase